MRMKSSADAVALIMQFEGFSPVPYLCPAGILTIGHGHVIAAHETFTQPITREMAGELLRRDIIGAERAVSRLLPCVVRQNRFDALVSFTFNVGTAALQRSQLRQVILRGDDEATQYQWLRWVYVRGQKSGGLLARRRAECALYFSYS
jgi:lysozyme